MRGLIFWVIGVLGVLRSVEYSAVITWFEILLFSAWDGKECMTG